MEFKERVTAPKKDNKYYYSKLNFDYPNLVDQCTWYAWGRLMELGIPYEEMIKKIPRSNAENWFTDSKFEKRTFPSAGDVLCYSSGKIHDKKDGMGHVAIVEHVYPDLTILISESGANMKFKTRKVKPPYKYYLKSKVDHKLDGFIHSLEYTNVYEWTKGDYTVINNKYLRSTPEVNNHNKVEWKNLTSNAKTKTYPDNGYARYKKGAIINIKEFIADKKGNIWGRTNQLWLCVQDRTGYQVNKIL